MPADPPDPSWFYSSVAQATAALVGFAGAFLLLRLQDYTSRWRARADEIMTLQREWSSADLEVSWQEEEYLRAGNTEFAPRAATVDEALERRRDDVWRLLRPLLDERSAATFPWELGALLAVLGLLLVVGCFVPLAELDAPSNQDQWRILVPIAVLVSAAGLLMLLQARNAFNAFKTVQIFKRTDYEHTQQLDNEDAYEQRMAEEKAERLTGKQAAQDLPP